MTRLSLSLRGSLLLLRLLFLLKSNLCLSFVFSSTGVTSKGKGQGKSNAKIPTIHKTCPRSRLGESKCELKALPPTLPWVVAHVVTGVSGAPIVATATRRDSGWYNKIPLPAFTPPNAIFAPVWTVLYALMGIAVGRIYDLSQSPIRTLALLTWSFHIVLNLTWAPIFFGFQMFRMGLVINVALWSSLVGIVLPTFYHLSASSAFLLLPYALWLTFANILNWDICRLNPTKQGYNNAKFQAQLSQLQQRAAKYAGV